MSLSDLAQVIELDHEANAAFAKGDPEPKKALYSRRDDATLANPLGPPARGWAEVERALEAAAAGVREGGGAFGFDRISEFAAADLAYIVEIERYRLQLPDEEEAVPRSLRVTTVFRLEEGEWRIVHRHADTITAPRTHEETLRP